MNDRNFAACRPSARRANFVLALTLSIVLTPFVVTASDWPPAAPLTVAANHDPGRLPASVSAEWAGAGKWNCTFSYRDNEARSVSLAGDFNSWNRDANPLTRAADGSWSATITLASGRYGYKFVVNNDQWRPDPANDAQAPDNHGGYNSVLNLGRLAGLATSPAQRGDGAIEAAALHHLPDRPLYFQPLSADEILVRYQTLSHDIEQVDLVIQGGEPIRMHPALVGPLFTLYETRATLPANGSRATHDLTYTFVLRDGDLTGRDPTLYTASYANRQIFTTPAWARDAIWYQIMPDRFRNGATANDPPHARAWTSEWFTLDDYENATGQTFYKYLVFQRLYGGDFQGIIEKLPYLKDLGVNAIYFNPVFEASTHHKYNATTYVHIDDNLGVKGDYAKIADQEDMNDPSTWQWTPSDKLFLEFLAKAHAAGIRVIIDGVFNHVGTDHPAFRDVLKNKQNSPYADWFEITSWEPFAYQGWAGVSELPVFRKTATGLASDEVKQHIFNVTRRWMDPNNDGDPSDGIDGWRLDVPNEIALPFWAEWRDVVKSVNPDAYIVGEIWDRADDWLDGQHFDAVMNYEFARAVIDWLGDDRTKITASDFDRRLTELRLAYPAAATYVLQNLVDSHDTDRLVSMIANPDRAYDAENRIQDNGPNYSNAKPDEAAYHQARLIALVQMTYVGAPMIYYGDEVGMWGADDPTNRKPMLWKDLEPYDEPAENHVMDDQLAFYKQAIALRNAHPALRTGEYETLATDDQADAWAFRRHNAQEDLIVVIRGCHPSMRLSSASQPLTIPLPAGAPKTWHVALRYPANPAAPAALASSDAATLTVDLPPFSGVVLVAQPTAHARPVPE